MYIDRSRFVATKGQFVSVMADLEYIYHAGRICQIKWLPGIFTQPRVRSGSEHCDVYSEAKIISAWF
jgi:hypothetical protein